MSTFKSGLDWFNNRVAPVMIKIKSGNGPLTIAANTVHADMVKRIFEDGESSDGIKIGDYAPTTKRMRQARGRQTSFVDLRFTGDLQLDFSNNRATTKINSSTRVARLKRPENQKKAKDNEKRFGKKIFNLTQQEKNGFINLAKLEFERIT